MRYKTKVFALNSTHKLQYGVEIRAGIKNISLFSSDGLNNSIK